MKRKIFNPKKCPYDQLLKHNGNAIVCVAEIHGDDRDDDICILRFVTKDKEQLDLSCAKVPKYHCHYAMVNEVDSTTYRSCFAKDRKKMVNSFWQSHTYKRTIEEMKNWDKRGDFTILHIDFY